MGGWGVFMLPCIDVEAVETAEGGEEESTWEQRQTEIRASSDSGNEGRGGEAEPYGDLFGKAMGAARGVDENEVAGDEASEDQVEVDGFGFEVGKKHREGDGGERNSGEEGGAVAVMEVVPSFEAFVMGRVDVERANIHQAIGGVEDPDCEGHGDGGGNWNDDVVVEGDEPGP
jgi:hypothetical protein